VAVGAGAVWVVESLADRLVRIDPDTRRVTASVQVGHAPTGVVVGRGAVWVANSQDGTVSRIDPRSNHVTRTIEVGGSPQSLSIANGDVWVTVQATPSGSSAAPGTGGTLRLSAVSDGFAEGYSPALIQIRYATCAKLVNYPDAPGPGGARLVPEVAESVPTATAGGRTYAFRIRRGFRFSPPSNESVTARTFMYSL
jgi:YVTN family beta-propeller protein